MQSNMVMRVTPLSTQEELAPKYQNHQSAKSPFPCPSYTNQDICTQLPRESWKLTGMVSLPNLELEEASKRKFLYFSTCCWKLLKQAKNYNVNLSVILLCFPFAGLCLCFLFTVFSPAGHLLAWWTLTSALCSSRSHFDPASPHNEHDSWNMDQLSDKRGGWDWHL